MKTNWLICSNYRQKKTGQAGTNYQYFYNHCHPDVITNYCQQAKGGVYHDSNNSANAHSLFQAQEKLDQAEK